MVSVQLLGWVAAAIWFGIPTIVLLFQAMIVCIALDSGGGGDIPLWGICKFLMVALLCGLMLAVGVDLFQAHKEFVVAVLTKGVIL